MTGPEQSGNVSVISGTLILIAYNERNRRAGRSSFEYPGEDFYRIRFVSFCSIFALSGSSSVKKTLDICFRDRNTGGTAIDHDPYPRTVGFSPCGDTKY